ncbi:hypothetical protein HispidOSU_006537 [Sigmodon hispidus]
MMQKSLEGRATSAYREHAPHLPVHALGACNSRERSEIYSYVPGRAAYGGAGEGALSCWV